MYSVIETEVVIEGKKHKTYGIKSENNFILDDISTEYDEVFEFAKILNAENVEEKYVIDFVEELILNKKV